MSGTTVVVLVIVCVGLSLAFAAAVVAFVLWVLRQVSRVGGWHQLATSYPVSGPAEGPKLERQTVKCGLVVYKKCVTVAIQPHGLHVQMGARNIRVPWQDFRQVSLATLYWRPLHVLHVGDPLRATIGVQEDLWRLIRPNLRNAMESPVSADSA